MSRYPYLLVVIIVMVSCQYNSQKMFRYEFILNILTYGVIMAKSVLLPLIVKIIVTLYNFMLNVKIMVRM